MKPPPSVEKWKEALELGLVRLRAVFAKLEGFGVFYLLRLVRRIPLAKFCPEAIGDALAALVESGSDRGATCFLFFSITHRHQVRSEEHTSELQSPYVI